MYTVCDLLKTLFFWVKRMAARGGLCEIILSVGH